MRRDGRGLARVAAAIGAVWDVVYLILVTGPSIEIQGRVVFYASFVGVMAALSVGSTVGRLDARFAQVMRYSAASGYLLAGALAATSIGLPLVLAGLLALASVGPRLVSVRASAAAAAISAMAFVAGIALTWPNP